MDMKSFDWKSVISSIAPVIGGAFGGPAGALAVKAVAAALLPPDKAANATEDDIAQAVAGMTPDDHLKLVQADYQFKLDMAKLQNAETDAAGNRDVQLEQVAAGDRASARQREMTVKDYTPMLLAFGITVGFFGVLLFMLTNGVPDKGHDALMVMLGSLGTAWVSVVAYYFGSSAGSARKTEMLSQK